MNHHGVARVIDRREKFQRGMQRVEAIPQPDGVGVGKRGRAAGLEITRSAGGIIQAALRGNENARAVRAAVGGIENGDARVQCVIRAAQEDEQQLLAVRSDVDRKSVV